MEIIERRNDVQAVRRAAEWERATSALLKAAEELLEKGSSLTKEQAEAAHLLAISAYNIAAMTDTI